LIQLDSVNVDQPRTANNLGLTHFTNRPLCVVHGKRTLELFLQPQPSFEVGEKLVFFPIFIPKVHKLILLTLIKNTEGNLTSLTD
jgi:hypothetical protein